MKSIIYNQSSLDCVGNIQENTTFKWEIENNVIPNFGGIESDYSTIETDLTRFHLETINGEVVAIEDGLTIEEQKQDILNQLKALDAQLMDGRVIEDIISGVPIHQSKLDIITQKESLREQLQNLGV